MAEWNINRKSNSSRSGKIISSWLIIYGFLLNFNEFFVAQAISTTRASTTTEENGTSTTIIYVSIGVAVAILLGLAIAGYIVYKKCNKKPEKATLKTLEEQPNRDDTYSADVLNHPSTFCEASTMAMGNEKTTDGINDPKNED